MWYVCLILYETTKLSSTVIVIFFISLAHWDATNYQKKGTTDTCREIH